MAESKRVLITGITGQDGSYLAELLLAKGYEVHGIIRRVSHGSAIDRIKHLDGAGGEGARVHLHEGDLMDTNSLAAVVQAVVPDEVYNLASQSHVGTSFRMPEFTAEVTAIGCLRLLEVLRLAGSSCRFYQAGSSEMFGRAGKSTQNEGTPFQPRSPYAVAKVFAHQMTVNYREAYGMFGANGILFNHESPRRGEAFLTRKVTRAVARIAAGRQESLSLGNLDAWRDWGHAPEYVEAMWRVLQHDTPDDFVIGTGEAHRVRDWVAESFACVGLNWEDFVTYDASNNRPSEVDYLCADPAKAREQLGWSASTRFRGLVRAMVSADLSLEGLNPGEVMAVAETLGGGTTHKTAHGRSGHPGP